MSKNDLEMGFEALRNGEFILVYDDDDREGEVDKWIKDGKLITDYS